jgi:hypothetical protein
MLPGVFIAEEIDGAGDSKKADMQTPWESFLNMFLRSASFFERYLEESKTSGLRTAVLGYAFTSPHRTNRRYSLRCALTASHRTHRMSANPIRILGKATFAIRTMRADDVTRKSEGRRSLVRIRRIAFPSGASVRWSASNCSSCPIPPFFTFSVLDWNKCVTVKLKLLLAAC